MSAGQSSGLRSPSSPTWKRTPDPIRHRRLARMWVLTWVHCRDTIPGVDRVRRRACQRPSGLGGYQEGPDAGAFRGRALFRGMRELARGKMGNGRMGKGMRMDGLRGVDIAVPAALGGEAILRTPWGFNRRPVLGVLPLSPVSPTSRPFTQETSNPGRRGPMWKK